MSTSETGTTGGGTPGTAGAGDDRVVAMMRAIEQNPALDRPVRMAQPLADALIADPARRHLLHGTWLGHALHPVLSDLPIGFWTSAVLLDAVGGAESRPAARKLVGLGIAAAVPTAVTGLSEWAVTGRPEQRVGVVHATANTMALGLFSASFAARRSGRHGVGRLLGLAGATVLGWGGYLGGHLTSARKVSTRHPGFAASVAPDPARTSEESS